VDEGVGFTPDQFETGYWVAVRVTVKVGEQRGEFLFRGITKNVFPTTRFFVTVRPIEAKDIEQESFRYSVLPHDGNREAAALWSEFDDAIVVKVQQAVPLEPRNRL